MVKSMNPNVKRRGMAGYPEVEKLIDTENFEEVNDAFETAYNELDEISRKRGGFGKSRDAKRAMKALELVMDLMRNLLSLKYKLQENAENQAKKNQK